MKTILYNYDNLNDTDINRLVRRAKIIIINSKGEILLARSNNNYFLPGGHLEDKESFDECIVREVKEETGINLPLEKRIPFLEIVYMNKDYPSIGINSKSVANYYCIQTDIKPNPLEMNLTKEEKEENFELNFIHKKDIINVLEESLKSCNRKGAVKDTIEVIKEFLKNDE